MQHDEIGLRELLLGFPLGHREGEDKLKAEIDRHIRGVIELLPCVYGETEPCRQAVMELNEVIAMRDVACKRAALLYALFAEAEVRGYWKCSQMGKFASLAADLSTRVLPFVVPRFIKYSCQHPTSFVVSSLVLTEMWQGEKLGNWPLSP